MDKPEGIFRVSRDMERAKDLLEMAKESQNITIKLIPETLAYKLLVEYYEICVQLATSLMYIEGYKTLNHISLINFLSKTGVFNQDEIQILEGMRRFRHGTIYYGRKEGGNFYINHKKEIKNIINKLTILVEKKLKETNKND